MGLKVDNTGRDVTNEVTNTTIVSALMCEEALQTYIGNYSVQGVDQDKVKGGGGGGGQTDLKDKDETLMRIS